MSKNKEKDIENGNNIKKDKKPFNKRKFKYGALSTAVTAIFIAVIVLFNILAYNMTDRFSLKIDITKDQIFEVSQETLDYLKTVENKVNIDVMSPKEDLDTSSIYTKQLAEVVTKYSSGSENITVDFIDMDKNPEKLAKYKNMYSGDIVATNIVITCGDRIKVLNVYDVYETQTDNSYGDYITGSKAEQSLTSAIMYVTDANPMKAVILDIETPATAMYSTSIVQSTLSSNGYDIETINPLTEAISDDANLVVIPPVLNDVTDSVITKLSDFLYNNGELGKYIIYMASYDQNATPKLDALLEEYGLSLGDSYVYETNTNASMTVPVYGLSSYVSASITSIDNEEYEEGLSNTSLPIVAPVSRPITLLYDQNNERETISILKTSETSALVPFDADEEFDITKAESGEQTVMAIGSKFIYNSDNEKINSSILALGSAYMVDTLIASDTSYNNGEFIINAINKMTGKTNGVTIVSKDLSAKTITITDGEVSNIRNFVVIIVPLAVIIIGVAVFIRRKNM